MQEKFEEFFFRFLDVLRFLNSCFKISVLRGEYFTPKISDITKTRHFPTQFTSESPKI